MTDPQARLTFDRGTLLLSGLDRARIDGLFGRGLWTWDARVPAWRCEAFRHREAARILREACGAGFVDEVPAPERVVPGVVDLPVLRPEQEEAVSAWRAAGGRGVVVMPTGTGKTEVALAVMERTGASTLVVSPVRDLMYQWHRRILRGLSIDAGILGDSRRDVRPVTVTTYDSAAIHMDELGARFSLVVFDEVHHLPGGFYRDAAGMCAARLRLGLTATPERADGRHADLPELVGPVVYRGTVTEAKGRTLADYETIRIPVHLTPEERERFDSASRRVREFVGRRRKDVPGYRWEDVLAESGKDPEARQVKLAYLAKKSIEDRAEEKLRVLEDLFRLHATERVIVFTGTNRTALDVSRRFLLPTILSHSGKRERLQVLEGFAGGRFRAVVANQVLDEGVDVPAAKVAVVLGGFASPRQAQQRLGRILRRTGEARAILYEVVCEETGEVKRSRNRRKSDAYQGTRHRRI
jgi:superfamily II DNA or RNA helicase